MLKLNTDRIQGAEYARQVFRVSVPKEVGYTDLLVPAFWVNVAAKMTKGDKIEALAEDGSWYAELLVVNCSRVHAQVLSLLFKEVHTKTKADTKKEDPDWSIEFKGPQRKWSVIRLADKVVVKENMESRAEANAWLEENKEAVTA